MDHKAPNSIRGYAKTIKSFVYNEDADTYYGSPLHFGLYSSIIIGNNSKLLKTIIKTGVIDIFEALVKKDHGSRKFVQVRFSKEAFDFLANQEHGHNTISMLQTAWGKNFVVEGKKRLKPIFNAFDGISELPWLVFDEEYAATTEGDITSLRHGLYNEIEDVYGGWKPKDGKLYLDHVMHHGLYTPMHFGRYQGLYRLKDVIERDPKYILFCLSEVKLFMITHAAIQLLRETLGETLEWLRHKTCNSGSTYEQLKQYYLYDSPQYEEDVSSWMDNPDDYWNID